MILGIKKATTVAVQHHRVATAVPCRITVGTTISLPYRNKKSRQHRRAGHCRAAAQLRPSVPHHHAATTAGTAPPASYNNRHCNVPPFLASTPAPSHHIRPVHQRRTAAPSQHTDAEPPHLDSSPVPHRRAHRSTLVAATQHVAPPRAPSCPTTRPVGVAVVAEPWLRPRDTCWEEQEQEDRIRERKLERV